MALKGIKVVEIAGLAPGPYCGMILADFGATVIRVDKTGHNFDMDCLANGKKSISLNLKTTKGVDVFRKLCKTSDVLIEPFRKGVMENLGLGPGVLLKDNRKLIYSRLTGFGQTGLYSNRAGHDINFVAISGILSLLGRYGQNPEFPLNIIADFGGGGLMCALGIILALFERTKSGLGQVVDNSMTRSTAYLGSWMYRSQRLPIWGNERGKNILDGGAHFYQVYKTKDGKYISVGAIEPQFYTEALKGLGLTSDEAPHFGDFEELKELLKSKFLEKTRDEWCKIFDTIDACVTPVLDVNEAPLHPHNVEQNTFLKTEEGFVPNPSPTLSRTPGASQGSSKSPKKGEHTRDVLRQIGISDKEIDLLDQEGVIECYKNSKL